MLHLGVYHYVNPLYVIHLVSHWILEGVTVSISYIGGSLDPGGSHYILGLNDLEDHSIGGSLDSGVTR